MGDVRYLSIALGSATELECHLTLAADLQFLEEAEANGLIAETARIRRMLAGLAAHLKRSIANSQ